MKSDLLGGGIAVLAAFMSIFGVNLQKYSHDREELRTVQRPYHLRPLWWIGMFCVVGASLGDFFALGFAPQTLVASLGGGSTILGNCLMSKFWLKQSLYITDVVGVALVTLGVVTLACASVSEPGHYKMEKIYELMQAAPFIVYCFVTTAFVMTLYLRVRRSKAPALRVAATNPTNLDASSSSTTMTRSASNSTASDSSSSSSSSSSDKKNLDYQPTPPVQQSQSTRPALMSPFPSPIFGETLSLSPTRLAGEEDDVLDVLDPSDPSDPASNTPSKKRSRKLDDSAIEKHTLIIDPKLPLYWAAISGTIGAQSMLLAKCVVEMISSTIQGDNQFVYFGTYVIVGAMVATLLTQTHTLNLATMSGDTMSAYPVFQAFWISMSNISGIVFFQQTSDFTSTQWMLFPSAIFLVVLGMTLIAKHEKFGNRVKYSVAMPISLSSPRQHDIVAQSFVFRVLTPQRLQDQEVDQEEEEDEFLDQSVDMATMTPRRRRVSVDVV